MLSGSLHRKTQSSQTSVPNRSTLLDPQLLTIPPPYNFVYCMPHILLATPCHCYPQGNPWQDHRLGPCIVSLLTCILSRMSLCRASTHPNCSNWNLGHALWVAVSTARNQSMALCCKLPKTPLPRSLCGRSDSQGQASCRLLHTSLFLCASLLHMSQNN